MPGFFSRPLSRRQQVNSRPLVGRVARGVVASLCLLAHLALLLPFVQITPPPSSLSNEEAALTQGSGRSDEPALEWITLGATTPMNSAPAPSQLPVFHLMPVNVHNALTRAASVPDVIIPDSPGQEGAEDTNVARLYERYIDQITGRIERAWLRPRTPIGSASFSCQAQIVRDMAGKILEIMLEQCNGTTRWQLSLVQAIQSASPLPVPPATQSSNGALHLGFTAEALSDTGVAVEYDAPRLEMTPVTPGASPHDQVVEPVPLPGSPSPSRPPLDNSQ
jgi:hypothetical protein